MVVVASHWSHWDLPLASWWIPLTNALLNWSLSFGGWTLLFMVMPYSFPLFKIMYLIMHSTEYSKFEIKKKKKSDCDCLLSCCFISHTLLSTVLYSRERRHAPECPLSPQWSAAQPFPQLSTEWPQWPWDNTGWWRSRDFHESHSRAGEGRPCGPVLATCN